MDLTFYNSLSQSQKNYARYIAERAKEIGLPPELAVAVAFKESSLNPAVKSGAAGEIGIMQIKPDTAKEMGFSVDEIKDPKNNIDAGLAYLKKSYDMSDKDPRLAAAGYNAGVNHPFFRSSDAQLPETTVNYLRALKDFGAFTVIPAEAAPAPEDVLTEKDIAQAFESSAIGQASLYGAAAGAGEAARRLGVQGAKSAAQALGQASEEGRLAAQRQAPQVTQQVAPQTTPQVSSQVQAGPRATGPGSATFNYGKAFGLTDIEAQRALDMSKQPGGASDLLARRREAMTGLREMFPSDRYIENPRYGGLMTPEPGLGPRQSFVSQPGGLQALPPRAPIPTEPPAKGALERVASYFEKMLSPESKIGRAGSMAYKYLGPPALGYQAGKETGAMLYELGKQDPDYLRAGLSGLGAAGAAMSAFPATAPVGIPLAITAPLIQYLRENPREGELGQMGEVIAP